MAKKRKVKQLTFYVPEELYPYIEEEAHDSYASVNATLVKILMSRYKPSGRPKE